MKITKKQKKLITEAIDELYYKLKARLLGRYFKGPSIFFHVVDNTPLKESLEGIFRFTMSSLYGTGAQVDDDQISHLSDIADNYIEAERLKTVNKVLTAASSVKTDKEFAKVLNEHMDKATNYAKLLINTETKAVQAYAERDGITQLAADMGVEDPIVCKLGIIDDKMCKNCKQLWHNDSNILKPKVYRLSELKEGYMMNHKSPEPTVGSTHPHCRHIMTYIPPNYGFDRTGNIKFIAFGHNEYEHQKSGK